MVLQVMEGLIDHLMTCSRLNQTKLHSLKVCAHQHCMTSLTGDVCLCSSISESSSWPR